MHSLKQQSRTLNFSKPVRIVNLYIPQNIIFASIIIIEMNRRHSLKLLLQDPQLKLQNEIILFLFRTHLTP